jgi:hypothetical protein
VTVDLRSGRVLGIHEMFRPDAMATLSLLALPSKSGLVGRGLLSPEKHALSWRNTDNNSSYDSHAAEVAWYPTHLRFAFYMPVLGTDMASGFQHTDLSYARLRALMKPDVAPLLPS